MQNLLPKMDSRVAQLHPACFAMAMATAIVSIAASSMDFRVIASLLAWLNCFIYGCLWLATLWRIIFHTKAFAADLGSHPRAPGFLSIPAATCLLGIEFVLVVPNHRIAVFLFFFGACLWITLIYGILARLSTVAQKPSLETGIDGVWFLATVATGSVSILAALLAKKAPSSLEFLPFTAICLFFAGAFLYLMNAITMFYRLMFFPLKSNEVHSPYWIIMGADSTMVLSGIELLDSGARVMESVHPMIHGTAIFFWSVGTWWIPYLLILGFWRFAIHRSGFSYKHSHWGMVYPLGMYTASTWHLSRIDGLDFLDAIPRGLIYIAFAAWGITFLSFLYSELKALIFSDS